jgi:hypothetical protein
MKFKFVLFTLFVLAFSACKPSFKADDNFDKEFQNNILMQLIRYQEKMPSGATKTTKFNSEFNAYYQDRLNRLSLIYLFKKDNLYYYYLTRIVPSLRPGDVRGSFGSFELSKENKPLKIKEYFLTNIMSKDKAIEAGEALVPLYFEHHTLDVSTEMAKTYIEWPNDYFVFDTINIGWERKELVGTNRTF